MALFGAEPVTSSISYPKCPPLPPSLKRQRQKPQDNYYDFDMDGSPRDRSFSTNDERIYVFQLKQEKEYEDRRNFIKNSPLFKHWNPRFRRLLEMSLRKEVFQFGSTMVRQGEAVQGLHFILTGQAQVTVRPAQHKNQYPKYFEAPPSAISKELAKGKLPDLDTEDSATNEQSETRATPRTNGVKQPVQKPHIRVRRKQGYAAAERRLADQSVTVSCLDQNEVIGDVEIILGLDTYSNTVVCTANTETFLLDVKNLERLVYKKNISTVNKLTQTVQDKLHARMSSAQVGQQVPLYKHLFDRLSELKPASQQHTPQKEHTTGKDIRASMKDASGHKEQRMSQLIKLFLKDRSPLISPAVPGSLYYISKSVQRAEMKDMKAKRKAEENALSANVRLERARKYVRRKPLSRRELERLCSGEPVDYMKQYSQNKDHAIGRILNLHPANTRPAGVHQRAGIEQGLVKSGPHAALGTHSDHVDQSYRMTTSTPLLRPSRVDFDSAVGGLFDMNDIQDDADGQRYAPEEDLDEEMIRHVMADMGGYQQNRQNARSKVICSMLEKRASLSPMNNILRPKSAPLSPTLSEPPEVAAREEYEDEDEDDEHFDYDTSEPALKTLEEKIKMFLHKYERISNGIDDPNEMLVKKAAATVSELKRFVVEGPDDIPIPGGTVYVRQKICKYPMGISGPSHQHIRRYMIPKNAYALATKSLAEISKSRAAQLQVQVVGNTASNGPRGRSGSVNSGTGLQRPTTAPVRTYRREGRVASASTHSAWG